MAEPTEAQRKRSQARERRRGQAAPAEKQPADGATEGGEEPLEAVKHAAKVAAAGAAVGAAAAAARALTTRGDDGEESDPEREVRTESSATEGQSAEPSESDDDSAGDDGSEQLVQRSEERRV